MPGLCGLLNHSLDRSLRPLPLLALSCPLALFFILFLPHCKLEKPVPSLGFYHAQNRSHTNPARRLRAVPAGLDLSPRGMVALPFCLIRLPHAAPEATPVLTP